MRRLSGRSWCVCAFAVVGAAGCGGGQGSAVSASAAKTANIGDAVVTYFGQPKPQLLSSAGNVTVVGQAGAIFSTVTLQPAARLDSTYLAVGRNLDSQSGIYTVSYPSGSAQLLYQNGESNNYPSISAYGTIAFSSQPADTIESVRADGTGLAPINFTGFTGAIFPAYSVDGTNRLAFTAGSGLYVGPGTGGTPSLVQSNNHGGTVAWNPAGTKLLYSVATGTGTNTDLYMTNVSGGSATDITPGPLQNSGACLFPTWSSDGADVAFGFTPAGSVDTQIIRFNINSPTSYNSVTPSGDNEQFPTFSPDGTKLAFYRYNTNDQVSGVYVEDAIGFNPTLIAPDPSAYPNSSGNGGMSWSPFLPKETVIAATGSTFYHRAASGFLLSQNGDQFGSVVAFTATTPADATIESPTTASQSSPLGFVISADSITYFGYINSYFGTGVNLTLSSTPSVVVTIDAVTGQVDLAAPAVQRAPATVKNSDGSVTYKATFKAVYDGTGKNLAPNGASSLTVNPKSGKLVTFK